MSFNANAHIEAGTNAYGNIQVLDDGQVALTVRVQGRDYITLFFKGGTNHAGDFLLDAYNALSAEVQARKN
jgi:hypothetical protein